ncbi:MAG: hypothetical protein QOE65_2594 [Solirubrobacteraceae bacterium]|jgi:hypothetical protein|nr:hypothetical protein [Solirubrobacteraceae bacterium]
MVQPRSREGDGSVGLRVERVDLVPTDLGTVIVRIAGRWSGDPAPVAPALLVGDRRFDALPESSGAAARAAGGADAFRAAFSVPEELRPSLVGGLRLALGETDLALPVPTEIEGDVSGTPGTVVDRAVLAERRARRAEIAEEEVARRAEEAEGSVAALEAELAKLELRLDQSGSERAELQDRLAEAVREGRSAAQRAHAERRRREEAVEETADRIDEAEHAAASLRARVREGDERAHGLQREIEALRRRVSEAEQVAAASAVARQRAERDATAARPSLGASRQATLRSEAAAARRPPAIPVARPTAAVSVAAVSDLLAAEWRVIAARRAAQTPSSLADESRRAAAAVAEAAWTLAEAQDAMTGVSGGVAQANAALARVQREREALTREREHLVAARAAAEAEVRRLREEREHLLSDRATAQAEAHRLVGEREPLIAAQAAAEAEMARLRQELALRDEAQARAERSIAGLASRIEELQDAAAAARRSAETEAEVRELSAAAGQALEEAERRIGEAQHAATEAQDRLDAERSDRDRAEAELRSAFDRERAELHHRLEEATTTLRQELETRMAALEAALEAERQRTPDPPAPDREAAPAPEPEPESSTPPTEAPLEAPFDETQAAAEAPPQDRRRSERVGAPRSAWLPAGLERLAAASPEEAGRLGVQLIPAQALASTGSLDYDLHIADEWHAVTLRDGRGTVAPLESHRARKGTDFRLDLDAQALVALLVQGGSPRLRKAGHLKVRGTLRRRRAVRAIPAADLDLGRLAEAGVWPDPGLVLKALAGLVDPDWTRGEAFVVALVVLGPRGGRWRVRARDGEALDVGPARTAEDAAATIRMTQAAYQRLLAGRPAPNDRRTHITGDLATVATLTGWIERAQRSGA